MILVDSFVESFWLPPSWKSLHEAFAKPIVGRVIA